MEARAQHIFPAAEHQQLSPEQRLDWLGLIRSENVGPATFRELIDHCGSARAALEALPELSRRGGRGKRIKVCAQDAAAAELIATEKAGARIVALCEPGYPAWLARVDAPPPVIVVKGDLALAERPIVSIVGARNRSALGQKFTRQLAVELGREGFVIASGLARGIDTAAHRAALERGTIAVLAGGVNIVYPPENADLQQAIAKTGLLITERSIGLKPRARDFPRRNRLISGIAAGVVVVEAAKRSGSLTTARFAGEQGREVFAVPGSPLDPRAGGTNALLKQGATLVTCADDIADALAPILRDDGRHMRGDMEDAEIETRESSAGEIVQSDREMVVAALGVSPVDVDEVIRSTGLPARRVQVILLELDLAGRLERHGQQLVSLTVS